MTIKYKCKKKEVYGKATTKTNNRSHYDGHAAMHYDVGGWTRWTETTYYVNKCENCGKTHILNESEILYKMKATWKNYIETPKKYNFKKILRKRCLELNLYIDIDSEDLHKDILDKILSINRETIFFKIDGEYEQLNQLYNEIQFIVTELNKD